MPARQHHPEVERLHTPVEVAELFKVNPLSVTRWAVQGRIGSVRTLGGHTRYKKAEVLRLLHGDPVRRRRSTPPPPSGS